MKAIPANGVLKMTPMATVSGHRTESSPDLIVIVVIWLGMIANAQSQARRRARTPNSTATAPAIGPRSSP